MKIAVSVGHTLSGADSGAVGYLNESKCTREIGELVKTKLIAQGHSVVFCRIDNASSVNASLAYRVNKANSANVDLFVEIHLNAGGGTGSETWIVGTGGTAEGYARKIVNSLSELGFANRGVKVGNFYVLKNTKAPAVLIECCFVDSKADYNRYNVNNIANKIVKGIIGKEVNVKRPNIKGPNLTAIYDTNVSSTIKFNSPTGDKIYKGQAIFLESNNSETAFVWYGEGLSKYGFIKTDCLGPLKANCKANYNSNVSSNIEFTAPNGDIIKAGELMYREANNSNTAFVWYGENLSKCGYIETKCLGPIEESTSVIKTPNVLYKVQVGAFSKKENAEAMVNTLKQKGINACIKTE